MSGPLAGLVGALLGEMSARSEFSLFINDAQRQRLVHGLFENYYGPELAAEVIFDTSRAWCARLSAIRQLFPASRVIACVRHVSWIVDSIERLVRQNAFSPSAIFNYSPGGTVYSRANSVAGSEGMVGYAYDALKEAFYGADTDRLMLVQYETLVSEPAKALAAIYDFIGEASFAHDFEHVQYDVRAFDAHTGTPGLHDVHPKVASVKRNTILPPDLFRRFENDAFWRTPELNLRGVRIV